MYDTVGEGEMIYNIDFLIAACIFLVFVFNHFQSGRQREGDFNAQVFLTFALVGFFDIVLDIVTSVMISYAALIPMEVLYITNTLFYLLQATVPFLLLLYAVSLSRSGKVDLNIWLAVTLVPICAIYLMVLLNPITGLMFSFEGVEHTYVHGPFYFVLFCHAVLYALMTVAYVIFSHASFERVGMLAILEFVVILGICVTVQFLHPDLLLTGFGIGLAITLMFFTLNNPFELLDPLTKVQEVEGFKRRVSHLYDRNKEYDLIFVDLNRMAELNDLLGRGAANACIKRCAEAFVRLSRSTEVFRIATNRFVIITHSRRELRRICKGLDSYFAKQYDYEGMPYSINASVGVVPDAASVESGEELQAYLDYLIDFVGNEQLAAGDIDWLERFRRREEVRSYLRRAIENGLLSVYWQPILSTADNKYHSVEVLSRLEHPTLGHIPPVEFITLAEEEGLVYELDRSQFVQLCRFVREHEAEVRASGITQFKFNVSPLELVSPAVADTIIECMHHYGLSPDLFCFEITETAASRYSELTTALANKLIQAGCSISLDDFGSGFANLDMIARFPFKTIKIDRTLLRDITSSERVYRLYQGIMNTITSMNLNVVCEGIETDEERGLVESWGANELQGYLLARPQEMSDALAFVIEENGGEQR